MKHYSSIKLSEHDPNLGCIMPLMLWWFIHFGLSANSLAYLIRSAIFLELKQLYPSHAFITRTLPSVANVRFHIYTISRWYHYCTPSPVSLATQGLCPKVISSILLGMTVFSSNTSIHLLPFPKDFHGQEHCNVSYQKKSQAVRQHAPSAIVCLNSCPSGGNFVLTHWAFYTVREGIIFNTVSCCSCITTAANCGLFFLHSLLWPAWPNRPSSCTHSMHCQI